MRLPISIVWRMKERLGVKQQAHHLQQHQQQLQINSKRINIWMKRMKMKILLISVSITFTLSLTSELLISIHQSSSSSPSSSSNLHYLLPHHLPLSQDAFIYFIQIAWFSFSIRNVFNSVSFDFLFMSWWNKTKNSEKKKIDWFVTWKEMKIKWSFQSIKLFFSWAKSETFNWTTLNCYSVSSRFIMTSSFVEWLN